LSPEIEGNVGLLTATEFDRFRTAVYNARQYVPWLRVAGYVKIGADPDEWFTHRGHKIDMPIGLPDTWLAAEEISSLLAEIQQWPTLENVAEVGFEFALQLTREVETAMTRWPMSDRAHAVKYFRCLACQGTTLRYYPPRFVGERLIDSVVKCTEKTCHAIVDEVMFTRMALLTEAEQKEKDERARRLGKRPRSALESQQVAVDCLLMARSGEGSDDASGEGSVAVSA